eukprot:7387090-Prymnesium_polylepis.1
MTRVREDELLDVLQDSRRLAALRQDRQPPKADVLDRAVGVLDLRIAAEDTVTKLGALVPAEAHDANGNCELTPPSPGC